MIFFCDCNIITTFLHSLSPFYALLRTQGGYIALPFVIQIYGFFYYMFLYAYMYAITKCTILDLPCTAHIMLHVYCFQGWAFGTRQPIGVFFTAEDCLCSHPKLIVCASLCGIKASWAFIILLGRFVDVLLDHLMFGLSCWWNFIDVPSDVTRKEYPMVKSLILWFLQCLLPCSRALSVGRFCGYFFWEWVLQLYSLIDWGFL